MPTVMFPRCCTTWCYSPDTFPPVPPDSLSRIEKYIQGLECTTFIPYHARLCEPNNSQAACSPHELRPGQAEGPGATSSSTPVFFTVRGKAWCRCRQAGSNCGNGRPRVGIVVPPVLGMQAGQINDCIYVVVHNVKGLHGKQEKRRREKPCGEFVGFKSTSRDRSGGHLWRSLLRVELTVSQPHIRTQASLLQEKQGKPRCLPCCPRLSSTAVLSLHMHPEYVQYISLVCDTNGFRGYLNGNSAVAKARRLTRRNVTCTYRPLRV